MREWKTQAVIGQTVIPIILLVDGEKITFTIGEDVFPIEYIRPYSLKGIVEWTLPDGRTGQFDVSGLMTTTIDRLPGRVAELMEAPAPVYRAPSATRFSAGSPAGDKAVAAIVKDAVSAAKGITVALDDEARATVAYVVARDKLAPLEDKFPGITDSEVCEAIWNRVGWSFNRGEYWSQKIEFKDAADIATANGISVSMFP
jgi:hypothetical protein